MDKETCFSVASLMANIHNITRNKKNKRINYNIETLVELPYEYAKSHFPESLAEMKFIKNQS